MANLKSSKKRARQNVSRQARNQARRSAIKTLTRKFMDAVQSNAVTEAQTLFVATQSEIARGKSKGIFKKNTAAHKVSRLAKQLSMLTKSAI